MSMTDDLGNVINLVLKLIGQIKYKYLGRFARKKKKYSGKLRYSRIISINNNAITFYRGNKYIRVRKNVKRIIYDDYSDWKLVQSRKGKKKDFPKLWEMTKDKQIKNWNFAGISENDKVLEVGFRDGYNLRYLQTNNNLNSTLAF